jgi:sterol desaturase/sphingolipid hydroxylase (fatty acid hydroxylase superfamily)
MFLLRHLHDFVLYSALPGWSISILIGLLTERARPANSSNGSLSFNLRYTVLMAWIAFVLTPVIGATAAFEAARFGGGWISIPDRGVGLIFSVLVLLAAKDFLDYWVHRAQHRFSFLWRMHSLHHSDEAVNVATAQRHYWLERPLFGLAVYPLVGIVFRVTPVLGVWLSLGGLIWSFFPHMNLRLSLGWLSPVVLGPQVHRLHHSVLSEHYDCNFAGIFPVWDVLFGTYRKPRAGEFPGTGIGSRTPPKTVLDGLLWPIQR